MITGIVTASREAIIALTEELEEELKAVTEEIKELRREAAGT